MTTFDEIHRRAEQPDQPGPGEPQVQRWDPPTLTPPAIGGMTYAEAARAAAQVVQSPDVIEKIRESAGIPDDDVIDIDLDWLTLDEIDVLEEMTGEPFDKFMQGGGKKGPSLRVLGLILRRRTDPHFPVERVGEIKVRMQKVNVPPTNGDGSAQSQPLPATMASQ
jgi:hypothetical protein